MNTEFLILIILAGIAACLVYIGCAITSIANTLWDILQELKNKENTRT